MAQMGTAENADIYLMFEFYVETLIPKTLMCGGRRKRWRRWAPRRTRCAWLTQNQISCLD